VQRVRCAGAVCPPALADMPLERFESARFTFEKEAVIFCRDGCRRVAALLATPWFHAHAGCYAILRRLLLPLDGDYAMRAAATLPICYFAAYIVAAMRCLQHGALPRLPLTRRCRRHFLPRHMLSFLRAFALLPYAICRAMLPLLGGPFQCSIFQSNIVYHQ